MVFILPHGHEDSECVLSFEIGQRVSIADEQTHRQKHRIIQYRISIKIPDTVGTNIHAVASAASKLALAWG